MSVFFTSDPHLGHKAILKYRGCFSSTTDHDDAFLSQVDALKKRDVLKILGDVVFDGVKYDYYVNRLAAARCRVQIMLGNHDSKNLYKSGLEIMLGMERYKEFWLSHCPIHPRELRGRVNIHGHLHQESIDGYINVNWDVNNYRLVSLDDIRWKTKEQG